MVGCWVGGRVIQERAHVVERQNHGIISLDVTLGREQGRRAFAKPDPLRPHFDFPLPARRHRRRSHPSFPRPLSDGRCISRTHLAGEPGARSTTTGAPCEGWQAGNGFRASRQGRIDSRKTTVIKFHSSCLFVCFSQGHTFPAALSKVVGLDEYRTLEKKGQDGIHVFATPSVPEVIISSRERDGTRASPVGRRIGFVNRVRTGSPVKEEQRGV